MTMHRARILTVATLLLLTPMAGSARADQRQAEKPAAPTPPPIEQRFEQPRPTSAPSGDFQREIDPRLYRRPAVRLFQNFTLPQGEATRQVVSILADVQIDGAVSEDVAVIMGSATIGSTAVIDGSLVVIGGSATVARGAKVGHDVVVIGGTLDAPADFAAGGEHVIIGTPVIGAWLRAMTPWLTRGVLLGRLIVPDIGWIWVVVGIAFLFGLLFNHVAARQVGACSDTLERRPVGAFFVGLLVIVLAGPAVAIIAVTVIGLPFAIAALLALSIIGKLGVTRTIGRSVIGESDPLNRAQAARSYVIGSAILIVAFMVPILGLLTWALMGVFGFGTATMTFMASLRKERPVPPPAPAPYPPPPVPPAPPFVTPETTPASTAGSTAFVEDVPAPYSALETPPPPSAAAASDALRDEPPPIASSASSTSVPPSVAAGAPPPFASAPAVGSGYLRYPRASFFDRLAAFALDAILVAIVNGWLIAGYFAFGRGPDNTYLGVLFIYHVAFWAWKGTTLGGIICNIRMVRTTGEEPRFVDALVRGLSAIFSVAALFIGCLWMLNDSERQMWHDKFAGTVVVKVPRDLVLA